MSNLYIENLLNVIFYFLYEVKIMLFWIRIENFAYWLRLALCMGFNIRKARLSSGGKKIKLKENSS